MRGRYDSQVTMLAFIDLETRVPTDHPLRVIKMLADLRRRGVTPRVAQNNKGRSSAIDSRTTRHMGTRSASGFGNGLRRSLAG